MNLSVGGPEENTRTGYRGRRVNAAPDCMGPQWLAGPGVQCVKRVPVGFGHVELAVGDDDTCEAARELRLPRRGEVWGDSRRRGTAPATVMTVGGPVGRVGLGYVDLLKFVERWDSSQSIFI